MPDSGSGWVNATAPLPASNAVRPLAFLGFRVGDKVGADLRQEAALDMDRLAAVVPGRPPEVIEDFEGPFGWSLYGKPTRDETFRVVDGGDRKSTRLNSSHSQQSRMPSSA